MKYVLTGSNRAGLQRRLQAIIADFTKQHGDSIERFDGTELTSSDDVLDAVRSVSLLDPRKLVIVRDFGQSSQLMDVIEQVVEQTADSTDLVLVDPKLDKRTSAYKYLQKNTELEQFSELNPRELAGWVREYTAGQNGTISISDAQFLVDRVGANQQRLSSEIDKLLLSGTTITRELIARMTDETPQSKVFTMLEALFSGRQKYAWELYLDQRAQGEEPQKLMAMITWQLQQLTVAVHAPDGSTQALTAAGISPYAASKLQTMARNISKNQLQQHINNLVEVDLQSKTSADVESALAVYFASTANVA